MKLFFQTDLSWGSIFKINLPIGVINSTKVYLMVHKIVAKSIYRKDIVVFSIRRL
jgi:hypothetical protein